MPSIQRLPLPYRPEADIVRRHLQSLNASADLIAPPPDDGALTPASGGGAPLDWAAVKQTAWPWVQAVRKHPPPFWAMESLLKEYPISSAEGLALMRLAEALLRVPDAQTAIALTADQLGRADFEGASDSALARLSQTAIAMSKKFLPDGQHEPGLLGKLGARSVVAATLRAVQLLGRQFVLGQDIAEAMHESDAARRKSDAALRFSYDMLGEGARTERDALRYLANYCSGIESIGARARTDAPVEHNDGISIKLSALHPRFEEAQRERVLAELVPRVWTLCERAARCNVSLTIDAEEVDRLELSLEVFEALAAQVAQHLPQWRGFGIALQSYQTRALELVEHVAGLARKYRLRFMCRLVKGAYWDAEIKRAQEMGLPHYPVFTHKNHTDISYLACARAMLQADDVIYSQFATHNAGTIAAILQMARGISSNFELQRLHGMGQGIYREISRYMPDPSGVLTLPPTQPPPLGGGFSLINRHAPGEESSGLRSGEIPVRIYAPVGRHRDLLAYLVRRLLENGANNSFVHQLADESVGMDLLLASPLRLQAAASLPLPPDIYGPQRRNSSGVDLAVESMRAPLLGAYSDVQVPAVALFDPGQAGAAVARSRAAYPGWRATPLAARANMLRHAADAMQAQMPRFCALLVEEGFKTWGDCVSEVREAVDFLRYYANEAERIMQPIALAGPTGESNELRLTPRGPWACISPWNFPLAIFTGQVAAALATGNTVLAKPAEQTPAIALEAVKLLHEAGVPQDALQLLHGPGETVGAALVADPGVAGVVFTGSTQVAKAIQRALAAKDGPIVPLIAETGGINAMVVDSTALPEQVADAVTQSAFRSAGQRCSALRLLCVHEGIADGVIEMIQGAARELVTGDPALLSTDVGPVIDREAYESIQRHLLRLRDTAKDLCHAGLEEPAPDSDPGASTSAREEWIPGQARDDRQRARDDRQRARDDRQGSRDDRHFYIPPQAFEVGSVADVRQEIFGPVLHIVRWSGDPLTVIDQVNALGYGLTLGIQTRIDSRALALAGRAHIGNVYVNRNMIGAVVGVQPFGGEGLSGTGPKAGGPHYLYRFCAEQTLTINTTAAGGNVQLLA